MADPIRCVYAMEDGYFCTKHSNGFYDGSCRLLEGKPCEDQKPPKPTTNYDRLVSKTPEELAETLRALTDCVRCFAWDKDECDVWQQRPCYTGEIPCKEMWIRWLGKEASE